MKTVALLKTFFAGMSVHMLVGIGFFLFIIFLFIPWGRILGKKKHFGKSEKFPAGISLSELSRIWVIPANNESDGEEMPNDLEVHVRQIVPDEVAEMGDEAVAQAGKETPVASLGINMKSATDAIDAKVFPEGETKVPEVAITEILPSEPAFAPEVVAAPVIPPAAPAAHPVEEKSAEAKTEAMFSGLQSQVDAKVEGRAWKHEDMQALYKKYVEPHLDVMKNSEYLEPLLKVMRYLDIYGDCPSVSVLPFDKERELLMNMYDMLKKVTLREHSIGVAREMIGALSAGKELSMTFQVGKILLASLGHDIGKIPKLRDAIKQYASGDHPYISYQYLNSIIQADLPGGQEVLDAVREHHENTKKPFSMTLKQADQRSRSKELSEFSPEAPAAYQELLEGEVAQKDNGKMKLPLPKKIDISWVDIDEMLRRLTGEINSVDTCKPNAFSTKSGTIFLQPGLMFDAAVQMAREKGLMDIVECASVDEKDPIHGFDKKVLKRDIEFSIKGALHDRKLIPDYIKETYTGGNFKLLDSKGVCLYSSYYIPIRFEAFTDSLNALEARKSSKPDLKKIAKIDKSF